MEEEKYRRRKRCIFQMVNNLSAQTRCCAGPLPVAQVSVCVSVNVLWGEGPLPAPSPYFWGLRLVANLERYSESKTLENIKINQLILIVLILAINIAYRCSDCKDSCL